MCGIWKRSETSSRPQRERLRCARRLPLRQTALEIGLHAAHALIAILRQLGQQLHHDVRDRLRHVGRDVARRRRDAGDMAMRPFQRIVRGKRQLAGQHAVKRDAERIEIGAVIHRAIHAPGLFGSENLGRRHVLKCMAWAGTGVVWAVAAGVPQTLGRLGEAAAAEVPNGQLTFLQISDTHLGFKQAANPIRPRRSATSSTRSRRCRLSPPFSFTPAISATSRRPRSGMRPTRS